MIKTVIFDFDGTIADTWSVVIEILKKNRKEWRLPEISQEMISDFRGKGIVELVKKYNVVLLKLPFIIPKAQKELSKQIANIKAFEGIREVLKKLKKADISLGILTTNSEENVMSFLKGNEMDFFDFIEAKVSFLSKDKALKKLLIKNQLTPQEVVYVGDEVRDIDAAKENNVKIISVTWGFNTREILQKNNPDYIVSEPEETLKLISK